uniref:Integrase catalytic domain-containing protein n=1 Tax=Musca domestica TaxID=7370 RepID=A0A1I8N0I0_MUSDO
MGLLQNTRQETTQGLHRCLCLLATKAVHLEVVTDLTTEAFIGALKRFVSRRGKCQILYSDNATNFVGAKNQLDEFNEAVFGEKGKKIIAQTCSREGIDFQFIPPRAPHFGGLWEAAVKSVKKLLLRTTSSASLNHEELETVVIEIETILNSRPLTPISDDPNYLAALTPGHFLVGEPLTAQVDPSANQSPTSLTSRWKVVSQIRHEFWKRWSTEYLNTLQERKKWRTPCPNVETGQLVIIKEDKMPVKQWPLGRITRTYKGNDGAVRVVDVKTQSGL